MNNTEQFMQNQVLDIVGKCLCDYALKPEARAMMFDVQSRLISGQQITPMESFVLGVAYAEWLHRMPIGYLA